MSHVDPPAQTRHVHPAVHTGVSCHIPFGLTDAPPPRPASLAVPRLSGGLEEGRRPVGGGFAGRIGVCQVLLEERKGVLRGQQSGNVVKGIGR